MLDLPLFVKYVVNHYYYFCNEKNIFNFAKI
jgi:hypothetical protein